MSNKIVLKVGDEVSANGFCSEKILSFDYKKQIINIESSRWAFRDIDRIRYLNGRSLTNLEIDGLTIPDEVKFVPQFKKGDVLVCIQGWGPWKKEIHKDAEYIADKDSYMCYSIEKVYLTEVPDISWPISFFTKKEQQEFQKITEDNLIQTLQHNDFVHSYQQWFKGDIRINEFKSLDNQDGWEFANNKNNSSYQSIQTTNFSEFLAFVQARVKLVPLVKEPEFDFQRYLHEHGLYSCFVINSGKRIIKDLETDAELFSVTNINLDKLTADNLIAMAETANNLERVK